jgi:hypothetical protein
MKLKVTVAMLAVAGAMPVLAATRLSPTISGDYLEVRSCDVFTGPCFANAEMGLTGKEGILVWSVREGSWKGTALDGLSVIAVVRTDATLGDVRYEPRSGKAVLIVDARANAKQKEALANLARSMASRVIKDVAEVKTTKIDVKLRTCSKMGCASIKADKLVEIATRCLGDKDHLCGNEDAYYPPLIEVKEAYPAFTELAAYKGNGLNLTWEATGQRSAYLAAFSR